MEGDAAYDPRMNDVPGADVGPDLDRRADYDWGVLLEADADPDPRIMLQRWLADAEAAEVPEFNSMALSTVDPDGRPCARNVLLRGLDDAGDLQFFTNRLSRKGTEIAGNPNVCLLFSWLGLHRQIRVQGIATPVDDAVSDEYFDSRPRPSRIGAWASEQSSVLADRGVLEGRVAESTERFGDGPVPRPPHWGGYAVRPVEFEFWQGRPSRLHDRLRYRLDGGDGTAWLRERLSP